MIKGIKVMLIPNNKQNTKLFQYAGASRFAYNWTLEKQQQNYKSGGKFIDDGELRKEFTQLKKQEGYEWLNSISNNVTKQAIKDACNAYKRFFKGESKFPRFKNKKKAALKFYQDVEKIQFNGTHVKFEGFSASKKKNKQKLNWVRLAEHNRIPFGENVKYANPRVSFDGLNWWISVGIEDEDEVKQPANEGIGIDLGIKDLAICSDIDKPYKNINKTSKVKKIKKKLRRLQRKISKKYEMNKEGSCYKKTCNIIKLENKLKRVHHQLKGIRHNYLHQTTSEIVSREPMFIVLEDLAVSNMMKNKHLAKSIQEQCFCEFYRQLEYKSLWNNVKFILADRFYPSSKMCSVCGTIDKNLKLSDRTYICECGNKMDRDKNASVNLKKVGELAI
ncbi:RNA-guided endonuclease InsQ/TnpB family protein [Clostridium formicaceticum]|uniref:Transposase n=1 Tax=Clostridium formicaceticum TaxID=1497 RepID=A0AAC9RIN1_9CLOT|nr:RNA-guided endonuclease TnpB family protein [Clostridium formicaceticum]AOY76114.1 transposase [Clostridium formicaceticum]ARE86482.1 putative transposase [Clostridium formicaceticum]